MRRTRIRRLPHTGGGAAGGVGEAVWGAGRMRMEMGGRGLRRVEEEGEGEVEGEGKSLGREKAKVEVEEGIREEGPMAKGSIREGRGS